MKTKKSYEQGIDWLNSVDGLVDSTHYRLQTDGSSVSDAVTVKCSEGPVWVCGLSDLHIGHRTSSMKAALKTRDMILERKAYVVGMHNYIEATGISFSPGGAIWDQVFGPRTQGKVAIEYFKPIVDAGLLIGLVDGICHEGRIYKAFGYSIVHELADRLGVPHLGTERLIRFEVGKQKYDTYVWHGSGGAQTIGGQDMALQRMQNRCVAEIYLMAHYHQMSVRRARIARYEKGKQVLRPVMFGLVGSHKDRDDWEGARGFIPGAIGALFIKLESDCHEFKAEI